MPIVERGEATQHKVDVRPSVAIELEWLLHSALREDFRADHPALHALYEVQHPELLEVVHAMWADEGQTAKSPMYGAFTELVLVAHHGGLLFGDDASALLAGLPELCASVPSGAKDWPLAAETSEDRRIALQRLSRLRRSAEVRRRFVDTVRQVWDAAAESWETDGRPAVAETVGAKQAMLSKGAGWRDLVRSSPHFGENAEHVIAALAPQGEIVVVPAYFAHLGLLYDLPGYVVLGIRADEPGHAARGRNEELSRRLRALSDPTRLAIVDSLRTKPRTVTELAQRFGLAQPTVSNHVKLLRDAGIVTETREATRKNLVIDPEVSKTLLEDLARHLGAGAPPPASPPSA
ncbi:MAG: metalloregulator ArsR/SmtB family transcription factor [Actinomycetota bacterium]|nr:metalloregulator ArsR/SmtB family transcription factor [Actinomycetota bacterium]